MRAFVSLLIVAASIAAIMLVYFKAIRPLLLQHPKYAPWLELADTRIGRIWEWLKLRKAEVSAGLAFVLPELPDLITDLSGQDWTSFGPGPIWSAIARALGIAAIVAKFFSLRKAVGGSDGNS